jgi:hypothetical protein
VGHSRCVRARVNRKRLPSSCAAARWTTAPLPKKGRASGSERETTKTAMAAAILLGSAAARMSTVSFCVVSHVLCLSRVGRRVQEGTAAAGRV